MSDGFRVDIDSFREDAEQWRDWSTMLTLGEQSISVDFEPLAFSAHPGFLEVQAQYFQLAHSVKATIATGAKFFDLMGTRVETIVDLYSEVEEINIAAVRELDV